MTARQSQRRLRTGAICAALFLLALGVRFLYWQDNRAGFVFTGMFAEYKAHALLLAHGDLRHFLTGFDPPSDADVVKHPPGYPLFLAAVYKIFGESDVSLRAVHITLDATACVLVFFIAAELFSTGVAVIAGLLVALSPQLAYHAIALLPDPLAPLPLLVVIYLLIRARQRPRLRLFIFAGALVGLSCWLRSNALLLAPMLALLVFWVFERGRRVRYALALVGTAVLVMLPVTIRNYVAFHHFIPLSLSAGITLVEGISVYDREHRFGLPDNDYGVTKWEAEMYHRPDYLGTRFKPDGVVREQARVRQGLTVIRQHPVWFGGVMLRRAADMLRFPRVELVAAAPAVTHPLVVTAETRPAFVVAPAELRGEAVSPTGGAASAGGDTLPLAARDSVRTLVVTPPVGVQPHTDYLLRLPLKLSEGQAVVQVWDAQRDTQLAVTPVQHPIRYLDLTPEQQLVVNVLCPFVSGDASQVRVVLQNGDRRAGRVAGGVGAVEAFALGPAAHEWTRYPRLLVRGVQHVFLTALMLPLIILGAGLMLRDRRGRELVLLLALPLYYMCVQSLLWTEFRYVIAMHYPLLILAALTLHRTGTLLWRQAQRLRRGPAHEVR